MSLAHNMYHLLKGEIAQFTHCDTWKELPCFAHNLMFGADQGPKKEDYVYLDLHCHLPQDVNLRKVINHISPRVDVLGITSRTIEENKGHLTFDNAAAQLEKTDLSYTHLGERVICVHREDRPLYLVRETEVYGQERQGFIFVGNTKEYHEGTDSIETLVLEAQRAGGFWFLDHPMSIGVPTIAFRYPTKEEFRQREEWAARHPDLVLETGNAQNTLWMFASNVYAQRFAQQHAIPQIANSDAHFNVDDIGRSRTGIPKDAFDATSEKTFFHSLREAFSKENAHNNKVERGYASAKSFLRYMILPHLGIKRPLPWN